VNSYFDNLKKHGVKLWLSNLLGNLAAGFISGLLMIIVCIIGLLVIFVGVFPEVNNIQSDSELNKLFDSLFQSPSVIIGLILLVLLSILISLLQSAFQTAGGIAISIESVTQDRSEIGTYFSKGFKYFGKQFAVLVLSFLFFIPSILLAALSIPLFKMGSASGIISGILLDLITFILMIVTGLAVMHATTIVIAENTGARQAISYSILLFRKAFGRVFGTAFLTFLINIGINFLILLIIGIPILIYASSALSNDFTSAGGVDAMGSSMAGGANLIINLISFVLNLIFVPIILALSYHLIVYRYFKYLRPIIRPDGPGEESIFQGSESFNQTPAFTLKPTLNTNPTSDDEKKPPEPGV
jgi:hypothetical protein